MSTSLAGYKETGDESCQATDKFCSVLHKYMLVSAVKLMPICEKIKVNKNGLIVIIDQNWP